MRAHDMSDHWRLVDVSGSRVTGTFWVSAPTWNGATWVKAVDVTTGGVRAELNLDSAIKVPADVSAAVHSRSAVGEQFVELIPATGHSDAGPTLRGGATIPVAKARIPPDIGNLLDATNRALEAIPQDNLRTVVDEADKAVSGLGPELSRIVNGSTSLAIEAGKTVGPITQLIDQSTPVLNSQVQTADSIATWAQRLASITGQFKAQDAAFAELVKLGQPTLEEGRALFNRFAPALPVLLANMVSLGEIAVVYRHDIEQLLVLFPQGTALMSAIAVADSDLKTPYRGIYLDFKLNMNLPPPCNTGFLPIKQQRVPTEVDYPERPAGELYCRTPQDGMFNVRGAKNLPCETVPGKRAATVKQCESNEPYVPLNDGYNWKGDPNATWTGQDVPQLRPGSAPPPGAPPPPPVAVAEYDPASGSYIGPDGKTYTQADLAHTAPKEKTWQSMMTPQPGS